MNHLTIGSVAAGDNWQKCLYPHPLLACIGELRYMDGWAFSLEHIDRGQGSVGLTLVIELDPVRNSYRKEEGHPRRDIRVHHLFIVPAAAYNKPSWRRWLLDRILDVHLHEACENFDIQCPICEGRGGLVWDERRWVPTRSAGRALCPKCNGEGYIKPYAPNHDEGYDPYTIVEHYIDPVPDEVVQTAKDMFGYQPGGTLPDEPA